jgi:glyceraldehyde 3-phosphate dehydrogenase
MSLKVAINGFGRIGRNAFKIAFDRDDIEIVAINDLTDTKTLAHLLKHDSNYGLYHQEVSYDETNLIVGGKKVRVTAEKDPAALGRPGCRRRYRVDWPFHEIRRC